MEEWVGLQWPRWVSRRADTAHAGEAKPKAALKRTKEA